MKNDHPLVSVVIPCYNHENFIQDSIQSVIDQTYDNIELIIIDDGSRDNSVIKIQEMIELCEKRFNRFEFRSRANVGLSATFNEGLAWCKGKYFSPNASDDMFLENKTSIQVGFLERNSNITAVFGGVKLINNNNVILKESLREEMSYSFKEIIMHQHHLPTPTHMTRLESIRKIGGYKSNLFIEDWYMWLKLSEIGELLYISRFFTLYRKHDNNISKNLNKMHSSRFEVLDFFSDSELYVKAVNNVKWLNTYEELIYIKHNRLKNVSKLVVLNPIKTNKILMKRLFKGFL